MKTAAKLHVANGLLIEVVRFIKTNRDVAKRDEAKRLVDVIGHYLVHGHTDRSNETKT